MRSSRCRLWAPVQRRWEYWQSRVSWRSQQQDMLRIQVLRRESEITQITNHSFAIYKNNLLVCPVLFGPSHNIINISPVSLPVGLTQVTGRVMDRGRKCLLWILWLVRKRKRMPAMSRAAHTFLLNNMAGRMTTRRRARWALNQPFSQPMATCLDGVIWTSLSAPPALRPALSPWSLCVSQPCLLGCPDWGEMGL